MNDLLLPLFGERECRAVYSIDGTVGTGGGEQHLGMLIGVPFLERNRAASAPEKELPLPLSTLCDDPCCLGANIWPLIPLIIVCPTCDEV